jgi:predicted SnoaL-like aldol condensation-catalyzing enzyme
VGSRRLLPATSFAGHQRFTPWDEIHVTYFVGEALWTYLNTPLLYTHEGLATDELSSIKDRNFFRREASAAGGTWYLRLRPHRRTGIVGLGSSGKVTTQLRAAKCFREDNVNTQIGKTAEWNHKVLVLKAFDTLFNKRDYVAAERFWSPDYIQHSAHIPPGRDGLFNLIKNAPPTLKYEPGIVVTEGDFVIVHGRYSGIGLPANWIVADIVRIENGCLAEHWDVIEDEATRDASKSGLPMFGDVFPQ